MRKLLFWLIILLFIISIILKFNEFEKLFSTLRQGKWYWILLALILQIIYYSLYTLHYQWAMKSVDIKIKFKEIFVPLFSSIFVNLTAPTAGTAGATLIVDDVRRQGHPTARAAAGVLLAGLVDYLAIGTMVIISLISLLNIGKINSLIIIGSLILLILISGLTAVIFLGLISPQLLRWLLNIAAKIANTISKIIIKKEFFSSDWPSRTTSQLTVAALYIMNHPQKLFMTLAISLISYIFNILSVAVLFLAFGQLVNISVLISGFAMGLLFWSASITPQGLGTMETAMILTYVSLGIPLHIATLVTLAFRGITLWLPAAVGFLVLKKVKIFS